MDGQRDALPIKSTAEFSFFFFFFFFFFFKKKNIKPGDVAGFWRYRTLGMRARYAGVFGISRPTLRKWLRRYEREGEVSLRARSRRSHHSPMLKVGETQEALILALRRERRLGVKQLRNELERSDEVRLSAATIHKVLTRHGLNVLPARKRGRRKPKRYDRPVPGDRVQMDTCKIRPGLYQFTAIDDCSRFLVAFLARRRSAHATLRFLGQVKRSSSV